MGKYKKKRKTYNVTYEAVDPLLPEMQKKVDIAFDILFDAVLKDRNQALVSHSPDSTKPSRPE